MKILVTSIVDLERSMHLPIHEYLNHLAIDHEVHLFSIMDFWKARWNRGNYIINSKIKINYHTGRRISPLFQELLPVSLFLYLLRNRGFDVHLNYCDLNPGLTASLLLKILSGRDTVFVIADDLAALAAHSPQIHPSLRKIISRITDFMVKMNIRLSRKVCLVTKGLKDKYMVAEEKMVLLPNGVDTDTFRPLVADDIRKKYSLTRSFVIGYVGAMREWIDMPLMFKMLSLLDSRFKLMLVGEEGKTQNVHKMVKEYNVEGRVIFTGAVPYDLVPQFINAMDVCLIPFKTNDISNYAMPMKMFEYMACRKPVISTPVLGVKESGGNLVLYASDSDEMAAIIGKLSNDEQLVESIGEAGREFVIKNYSWSSVCSKLEDTLLHCVSR